jgi:hypothetical protein
MAKTVFSSNWNISSSINKAQGFQLLHVMYILPELKGGGRKYKKQLKVKICITDLKITILSGNKFF